MDLRTVLLWNNAAFSANSWSLWRLYTAHFGQLGRRATSNLLDAESEELLLELYKQFRHVILGSIIYSVKCSLAKNCQVYAYLDWSS